MYWIQVKKIKLKNKSQAIPHTVQLQGTLSMFNMHIHFKPALFKLVLQFYLGPYQR